MLAWLKLLRLPNIFTAIADVAMGYLVTHRGLDEPLHFALLATASCLLYLSGMVLNDVFDAEVDAVEQPSRPIPSGHISRGVATTTGWSLWIGGVTVAWLASLLTSDWRPGVVATTLAACVLLYNRVLKQTPIAPLAMGACRGLNVLLGMSLAVTADLAPPEGIAAAVIGVPWGSLASWLIAAGIGVYIVGVTIFASTDAHTSARSMLFLGLAVLLAGMLLLTLVPIITENQPPLVVVRNGWLLLWTMLLFITSRRCLLAITQPTSTNVQTAVRHCIQSLIVLDAAVIVGYAGPAWGLAVLALIFPTLALTAWIRAS